ncbi:nuclear transport factor 2 family protein [Variovorax guangxiensis]|uniref:nuclear transport factor 2 family protein n=1 Tax=Variovorax guangxiensis TaxID=1775474 RepID=UPI00285A667B|nr:nuclear transport factor 2 family protein [Variovorax guangxiensis]MDR6858777.1 hypothetical protein [Variovorax guangxiensis]
MTATESEDLHDRAAIHDVLMRYFNAADRGQKDVVRSCFTDDVWAQYEGRPAVRGVDALIAQIALFDNLATGACRTSTHFAGNLVFKELARDHAETENNVFAFLVNAQGTTVAARSLRYLDRLRRVQGQWKIFARLHTLDWSCEMPCALARAFAQKVHAFPTDWPTA